MVPGYEFTSSQNELIGDLAKKMNFVGILMAISGVISLIAGILTLFATFSQGTFDFSSIVNGVFLLLIGLWTRNAAQSFSRVVNTTGTDIENMMGALAELRKLYTLQYWLIIIVLIFLAIALLLALVATISGQG